MIDSEKKEQYIRNVEAFFDPRIDLKKTIIALIMDDTAEIENLRVYISECQTKRAEVEGSITDLTDEKEILSILGNLTSVQIKG